MSDIETIKKIEKIIPLRLRKTDFLKWDSRGFTQNKDGKIDIVSLFGIKNLHLNLEDIVFLLKKLPDLKHLSLSFNQLHNISCIKPLEKLTE